MSNRNAHEQAVNGAGGWSGADTAGGRRPSTPLIQGFARVANGYSKSHLRIKYIYEPGREVKGAAQAL
jgi:hypothetical protein